MILLFMLVQAIGIALSESKVTEAKIEVKSDSSLTDAIVTKNYPESAVAGEKQIWKIKSDEGTKIIVTCSDLRISPSEGCEKGYLEVHDGASSNKYCGSESALLVRSVGSEMTITFELYRATGLAKCSVEGVTEKNPSRALPYANQETIHLPLGSDAYDKIYFTVQKEFSKVWKFTTDKNKKISVICDYADFLSDGSCKADYISLNSKKICAGQSYFKFFSEDNSLNFEIKSYQKSGLIDCLVQAVSGPHVYQYQNLASEEMESGDGGVSVGEVGTTCKCGWSKKQSKRILNGKDAGDGQYPWMAWLFLGRARCGGSIITRRHILTAAHCTSGTTADKVFASVGSYDKTKGTLYEVEKIIGHDFDRRKYLINDISILLLKKPLDFSEKVGPVCLTRDTPSINHKYVIAMGWGSLGDDKGTKSIMQHTNLRALDFPTCNFEWYRKFPHHDRICAVASNRTACAGDSGSSVVYLDPKTNRYTQLGVKSFTGGCNTNKPLVNTLVPYFYDWILKVIKDTDPSVQTCTRKS